MFKELEVKASCYKDGKFCGKCCYKTEMPLSRRDIERIESLGYNSNEFAVEVKVREKDKDRIKKRKL